MSEEVVFQVTQAIFIICFITILIVDFKSIANGISKLKNKIHTIRYRKELAIADQNRKHLYNYIFYVILPKLSKDQFIKVCSNKFKYNDSTYELYFEKRQGYEDFYYQITLKKVVGINRYISPLLALVTDTTSRSIFLFHFTRNGPKNIHISFENLYKNNLEIILVALLLINGHSKANNINYYPEFKGDKEIDEQ